MFLGMIVRKLQKNWNNVFLLTKSAEYFLIQEELS